MLAAQVGLAPPGATARDRAARCRPAGPAREVPEAAHARVQPAPDASNSAHNTCTNTRFSSMRSMGFQHTQHTQHTGTNMMAAGMARPSSARAYPGPTPAAMDAASHAKCLLTADEGMDGTWAAAAAAAAAAPAARLRAPLTVGSRSIDSRRLSRRAGAAWHSMARCSPAQHSMAQPQQPWQPQRSAQLGSARHGGWREAGLPARVWPSTAPLGPPRVAQPRLRRL